MLNLAPHSRIWIFQANRFLSTEEVEAIQAELKPFIAEWASHGEELFGDFSVENELFLIIGADEQRSLPSGCSIDTLTHKIQELGDKFSIDFFDRLKIAYEDASTKIHLVTMGEFKQLMSSDDVTGQTTVYNNLIETVADLDEKWRTKVTNSWHTNLLEIQ